MTIYHKHHIIPKYLGGTDEPSNLILLTIEEHAAAHEKLYNEYGNWEDYLAWKGLSGHISKDEINKIKLSEAGKKGANLSAKPWWTNGIKNKRSINCPGDDWHKGRILSEVHKLYYKQPRPYGRVPKKKYHCQHCNKIVGGASNFKRWHGDNCKEKGK